MLKFVCLCALAFCGYCSFGDVLNATRNHFKRNALFVSKQDEQVQRYYTEMKRNQGSSDGKIRSTILSSSRKDINGRSVEDIFKELGGVYFKNLNRADEIHSSLKRKGNLYQQGQNPEESITRRGVFLEEKSPNKEPLQQPSLHDNVKSQNTRKRRSSPPLIFIPECSRNLSCRHKCLQVPQREETYEKKPSCYCDANCEFFLDCCADYSKFCKSKYKKSINFHNTNFSLQGGTIGGYLTVQKELWQCFNFINMVFGIKGIWMIGSCPTTWPKDDIFYQCRNLSVNNKITKDNYRYLPVYTSNGTVYHNRFCAQCNGVALDDLKSYQLSMECHITPPAHFTFSQKLEFLFMYCSDITWEPLNNVLPRRYCLNFETNCSSPVQYNPCNQGPVGVVVASGHQYRNKDCANCNGFYNHEVICGPIYPIRKVQGCPSPCNYTNPESQIKPMSLIFDFSGVAMDTTKPIVNCFSGDVYDPYLEICRKTLPRIPEVSDSTQYEVTIWLERIDKSCSIRYLSVEELVNALKLSQNQVLWSCFQNQRDMGPLRLSVQLNSSSTLSTLFQKILNFKQSFNITVKACTWKVIKSTARVLSCPNLQVFKRDEYFVPIVSQSAVIIKSTGEVLQSKEYYTDDGLTKNNQPILVCRQNRATHCSKQWVFLNEAEVKVFENKSIFVKSSARLYNISEYIWQNRSLFICENYKKPKKNDDILAAVTIVCMSMSIISLVFVLVTYSLYTELRTPPGINLMNLSVTILLSQLLWLLGSGQTDNSMTCTAIAVLLHYFFLVSFVWTSIIAFDTWRAFTAKGRRCMNDSKRGRLLHSLRYMAVGWLSVMVYVAICFALDLTNTVIIGYQSNKACWMSNPWAILSVLAAPVVLILAFNLVTYILTMRAINVTTAQARAAADHKNRKNTFGIYVRIASAMGFTWMLGFIAPFGMDFLWYPFVVLNGLQGLYIALAFGLNQRARRLWKMLLGGMSSSNGINATHDRANNTGDDTSL